jgi:uncharacterized protein HemX
MDVLVQAQALVVQHAFTIGMGLLVAALIAGVFWFWMSRNGSKSNVLENQARVNEASTEEQMPSQEQLEEMAKYREQMEAQQGQQGQQSQQGQSPDNQVNE